MPMSKWEQPLNTHWVCMNANEYVGTAREHPMRAHDHQWVTGNSPWTSIECAWMPLSECEHLLSAHECHWVIIECNSPWCDHEKDCIRSELHSPWMLLSARERLWLSIEHSLNAIECTWTPLSEYWTLPECLWVRVNTFEWVLKMPWMLVSAHECQWVSGNSLWTSIECTRTPLSKYLEGLNAHL